MRLSCTRNRGAIVRATDAGRRSNTRRAGTSGGKPVSRVLGFFGAKKGCDSSQRKNQRNLYIFLIPAKTNHSRFFLVPFFWAQRQHTSRDELTVLLALDIAGALRYVRQATLVSTINRSGFAVLSFLTQFFLFFFSALGLAQFVRLHC